MTAPSPAGEIAARLEARFRHIQRDRLADFPLINPALEVRAVGFRQWQGQWLGVLVTPWFMNLLLLPLEAEEEPTAKVGEETPQAFPSGNYVFIQAHDEQLGAYQTCSLYSPMHEFHDQASAEAVAAAVLTALMDPEQADAGPMVEKANKQEENGAGTVSGDGADAGAPISRRDLLRGVFRRSPDAGT